jgi:hypothetical protein
MRDLCLLTVAMIGPLVAIGLAAELLLGTFRPWSGEPYRGSLEYVLDDGRKFEVRRDFESQDIITQVLDTVMGADVTAEFGRGRHGNVPFARKHLGMSRAVFQSCAFISQGEIFDIGKAASPSEIGDAIAALADSPGEMFRCPRTPGPAQRRSHQSVPTAPAPQTARRQGLACARRTLAQ